MCAFQQKQTFQLLKYIFLFKTFNDILYIKFIKNDFPQHHSKIIHIHQKNKKSHITHPIFMKMHPCLYLHDQKIYSWNMSFKLCGFSGQKHVQILFKNLVDNHIRRYIQTFITIKPS